MSLHVTTQNFTWYKSTFSLARQTARVFGAPTNPHEIIYCHILFSSCFIYESFVSQIKTINFFRANQMPSPFLSLSSYHSAGLQNYSVNARAIEQDPSSLSFLFSEVQLNGLNAVTLSAFILCPASVTTVLQEGKFNLYISSINAAPARIINNDHNQCQFKWWVLLHTSTCHPETEPKIPTPDSSLFVCTWRKTNDQSYM